MLWWMLQNLVIAGLMAGCVRLACVAFRIGPVVRHALWLVVLLKLLTPPLVAWPWAIRSPLHLTSERSEMKAVGTLPPAAPAQPDGLVTPEYAVETTTSLDPSATGSLPASVSVEPKTTSKQATRGTPQASPKHAPNQMS